MRARCAAPVTGFDGLAACLDQSGDMQACHPAVDFDFQFDRREHRLVHGFPCRRKNLENSGARFGILAAHDPQERLALLGSGALVDDGHDLPMSFVNCAGPGCDRGNPQSAQRRVPVMSFLDVYRKDGIAAAVRRPAIELTRAAVVAIAMYEFAALDRPHRIRHVSLPIAVAQAG